MSTRLERAVQPICLHDRERIAAFLLQDPYLHLYALGDLDDFFWPFTTWYAAEENGRLEGVLLVYSGSGLPVLLGLDRPPLDRLRRLLRSTAPFLPRRFYAHLSEDAAGVFQEMGRQVVSHGRHLKMALSNPALLDGVGVQGVEQLSPADLPALQALYSSAYPGNWFDPRMLETGCYYGARRDGMIASVAGIHVYSPRYRAAALGNITTHPAYRGQGLCTAVTARLCQALSSHIDFIGLNVLVENRTAVHCYEKLGFIKAGEYEEFMIQ